MLPQNASAPTKASENRKLDCRMPNADSDGQNMIANPMAENHHPGGTGPPDARELWLVQVAPVLS